MVLSDAQRKANRRLGLTLALVAVVFGVGFVLRFAFLGG